MKKTSVAILVFNTNGDLALQLRAAHDDKYPSHWDFSAAGGIEPGEDHKDAAPRELFEEIGIKSDLAFLKVVEYEGEGGADTIFLYKTIYDGEFNPDSNEVAEVKFFSTEDIQNMIETGEKIHPEFIYMWREKLINI